MLDASGCFAAYGGARAEGNDGVEWRLGGADRGGKQCSEQAGAPASTEELQTRIGSMLGEGERRLLGILIVAHPGSLTRVDLAARAGYSNAKSGGLAPLARLIELGLRKRSAAA